MFATCQISAANDENGATNKYNFSNFQELTCIMRIFENQIVSESIFHRLNC